jgi:AraC-like DNA-binding protein
MADTNLPAVLGLVTVLACAVVAALALVHRHHQGQIDRLMQRLDQLEARWKIGASAAGEPGTAPAAPAAEAAIVPPRPGREGVQDVLAGWTSHVGRIVRGESVDTMGLADDAIVRVHGRLSANLSPRELAADLCVSLRTLERGLAAALKCTPSELILAMKMREARRLLASGRYRVGEVADRLGFSSPFHFSRRFKAYYRVPPSELRELPGRDR